MRKQHALLCWGGRTCCVLKLKGVLASKSTKRPVLSVKDRLQCLLLVQQL
jgi:hypothetical protein